MVISSDFRMGKHRDDDHEKDAPYFIYFSESSPTRAVRLIFSFSFYFNYHAGPNLKRFTGYLK